MSGPRLSDPPRAGQGGLFGSAAYLGATALHDGGTAAMFEACGVALPVVLEPEGGLHTPDGYPQPRGECTHEALHEFVKVAVECLRRWRCALAPIGPGAELAELLAAAVPPRATRLICVHELDAEEPLSRFRTSARGMVRRALKLGVQLDSGAPTPEFGALYRDNMDALEARPEYYFDDDYLLALARAGAVQVEARDQHGLAAAALFLIGPPEASYHLSARRLDPPPAPGAANLILAVGLGLCRDAGASHCYLGGGRTTSRADPLLQFKVGMSTRVVERPSFEHLPR